MKYSEFVPVESHNVSAEQLTLAVEALGANVPEIWREIAELNFVALRCNAELKRLSDQVVADIAAVLVYQLIASMGGNTVYLANGFTAVRGEKYALIAKEYTGNNLRQLARRYQVSEMRVRQIIQEQADLNKSKLCNPG